MGILRNMLAVVVGLPGGGAVNMFPFLAHALDLVAAYVPMAWLGTRIGERLRPFSSPVGAA